MYKETKGIKQVKELWQYIKPHIHLQPLNFDFYIREANFSGSTETFALSLSCWDIIVKTSN